jgi:hypothetical protein
MFGDFRGTHRGTHAASISERSGTRNHAKSAWPQGWKCAPPGFEPGTNGLLSLSVRNLGNGRQHRRWAPRLLRARRRPGRGVELSPWLFFVLPPLAFASQEFAERLLRAEAFPFQAALEPRFLLGLALQLPFGLLALFVARVLLRVVERLVRALARTRTPRLRTTLPWSPRQVCALARIPALALGHSQRGPPSL